MFYLIQFFKIITKNFVRGFFLIILSALLIISIVHKDYFESMFWGKVVKLDKNNSYFYALLSTKKNSGRIRRKMTELPGVQRVELLSNKKIEEQVQKIVTDLNVGLERKIFNMDYVGLKIVFTEGVQEKSKQLIREYLVRLTGEDSITLGQNRSHDEKKRNKSLSSILEKWGGWGFVGLIFILWLVTLFVFRNPVYEMSYIIEQFQRKKYVAFKMMLSGLIFMFILSLAVAFSLGVPSLMNLTVMPVVILLGASFHLKRVKWKS